jgi:GNAT superfamily N-acetyltransferase
VSRCWPPVTVRLLHENDQALLERSEPDVFDHRVDPGLAAATLRDPRHHLVAAVEGDCVVGFASAVDYVHPDKPRALWINEVSVAERLRGRGIGKRLICKLLGHARALGCFEAWVLTDAGSPGACTLYRGLGGSQDGTDLIMFSFDLCPTSEAQAPGLERE